MSSYNPTTLREAMNNPLLELARDQKPKRYSHELFREIRSHLYSSETARYFFSSSARAGTEPFTKQS